MRKWLLVGAAVPVLAVVTGVGAYRLMNSRTFPLLGDLTARIDTDDKVVALTFDLGPDCDQVDAARDSLRDTPATPWWWCAIRAGAVPFAVTTRMMPKAVQASRGRSFADFLGLWMARLAGPAASTDFLGLCGGRER